MMSDETCPELRRQLDLLLSAYSADLTPIELAAELYASANGLVTLVGERPRYRAADRLIEVPFTEAADLEAELENLLSTRVICLSVDDVPLLTDLTVRIVCGTESVDLTGRAVQNTAAGMVVQLNPASVDTQRAIVGLPAVLRSNPTEPIVVNRRAVRVPKIVGPAQARAELFPPPPPAPATPSPEPAREVPAATAVGTAVGRDAPAPEAAQPSSHDRDERIASSRLALNLPKVDAALARSGQRSHFEFLSIHFSSDTERAREARAELLELIEQCRADDRDGALDDRLARLTTRIEQAWAVLQSPESRRAHRREMVPTFQVETAVEMYEGQAEAALLSRKISVARDCYRRIAELEPSHPDARLNMNALGQLEDG